MFLHDVAFSQLPPLTSILMSVFAATLSLRVKHPNILQLVDVFETKKEYFLFLELWVQTSNEGVQGFLCVFAVAHLCVVLCPHGNSYDYLWKMLREIFRWFFFGLDVGVENSFLLLLANAEKQSKNQKKHCKHVGFSSTAPQAERCLTGSWTKATTRSETPATWSGRCWRLWPTCTRCKSSTETSR